jgi:RNase adaptor protein for sRNA GlmZ degradation
LRNGIPEDSSTQGGGFVFDYRSLPNPGRITEMQIKTGFDDEVNILLESDEAVKTFLHSASSLVSNAINNYLEHRFTDLMVSFGCTGGQHRSVFCANALSALLISPYSDTNIIIDVTHRELK